MCLSWFSVFLADPGLLCVCVGWSATCVVAQDRPLCVVVSQGAVWSVRLLCGQSGCCVVSQAAVGLTTRRVDTPSSMLMPEKLEHLRVHSQLSVENVSKSNPLARQSDRSFQI